MERGQGSSTLWTDSQGDEDNLQRVLSLPSTPTTYRTTTPQNLMPTYPVKHTETGETKELYMTMKEYEEWCKENPGWGKDWQAGVAGVGEVGEWQNKLMKTHPGWKEVMNGVKKAAPTNRSITEKY